MRNRVSNGASAQLSSEPVWRCLRKDKAQSELASAYELNLLQITQWEKRVGENLASLFEKRATACAAIRTQSERVVSGFVNFIKRMSSTGKFDREDAAAILEGCLFIAALSRTRIAPSRMFLRMR